MTENFKQKCREATYKNKLGKLLFDNDYEINGTDYLTEISTEETIFTNGTILGSCNSKLLKASSLNDLEITDDHLEALVGIKYDSSSEYLSLGKFTITEKVYDKTNRKTEIKALDEFSKLNDKYICGISDWEGITLYDILEDLCTTLGWTLGTEIFINQDLPVNSNQFQNDYTNKEILSDILECSCSFGVIENSTLYLRWFDDEVSEVLDKSQYSTLEIYGEYKKVNSLVIRYSQVEGENVTREDSEDISENGLSQIVIADNNFLYTEELKQLAIDNIWNRIKGFGYIACKIVSHFGKPYLKLGNKIKVQNADGSYFDTFILSHNFKYDGTFYDEIDNPLLSLNETKLKNTRTNIRDRIRNAEITSDKANAEVRILTQSVNTIEINENNNYQELLSKFEDYVPSSELIEIENKVEQIQTDTYTKTEINTKLTDGSVTKVLRTSGMFDENGLTIEKTNAKTKGNFNEKGMKIMDSTGSGDTELLFAGYDEGLNETIVRTKNIKVTKYLGIGKYSRIEDYKDENGNNGTGIFFMG